MASKQNGVDRPRVAVTGIGVIAANGIGLDEFSKNLFAGVQGVRSIEQSATLPAGYTAALVSKSLPDCHGDHNVLDRAELLALLAADEAMHRSRLGRDPSTLARSATTFGTMAGTLDSYFRYLQRMSGKLDTSECIYPALLSTSPGTITARLARHFQMTGGALTTITACTAGANAIALGVDMIRLGRVDVVLACAADSFSEVSLSGFDSLKSLTKTTCKPFDKNRDGLVLGEGSGALVLEEWQHAVKRQAAIYAEVTGYGLSNDAFHPTQPDPEAGGACRAIKRALADSGLVPEQMDYINAHGTSTKYNDLVELTAIRKIYGDQGKYRLPISSSKSMIGHTLGAAGMIGAIATIMALDRWLLPPTVNFETPMDDCGYDFLPASRPAERANVMSSHSFAFAGNAACLVFCRGTEGSGPVRAVADTTF